MNRFELAAIDRIMERAETLWAKCELPRAEMTGLRMDIVACHTNGCPLRLEALADAPGFDFAHDVFGIHEHLNRETRKLKDCFLPRYAQGA